MVLHLCIHGVALRGYGHGKGTGAYERFRSRLYRGVVFCSCTAHMSSGSSEVTNRQLLICTALYCYIGL